MKKYLFIAAALLLAMVACNKEEKKVLPTVSISATQIDAESLKATGTLTLTTAAEGDVTITLAEADVQSGKTKVPASFDKTVRIPQGKTSATFDIRADVTGLADGDYQVAVSIASAEGAEVAANAVAYANLSYAYVPTVNLYTGGDFVTSYTSYVTVALDKAASKDVKVILETAEGSTAPIEYEANVTIPAGKTSVDIDVVCNPETLETGDYSSTIKIKSAENGKLGTSVSSSLNISYPFIPSVIIDGDLSDWDTAITQDIIVANDAKYKKLVKARFAASPSYLYVLLEMKTGGAYGENIMDFYIDADGDPATGAEFGEAIAAGCAGIEWLYEQNLISAQNTYANGIGYGRYKYTGENGGSLYGALTPDNVNDSQIQCYFGTIADGTGRLEMWFNRANLGIKNKKVRVAFKMLDWATPGLTDTTTGYLPQIAKDKDDTYTPCDMFTVHIPAYAE